MRIAVVFGVPPRSRKASTWNDGFTAAVDLLASEHDITWINVLDTTTTAVDQALDRADSVLVKSSFGGVPDVLSRPWLARRPALPAGLMVSGTGPPRHGDTDRFDVLFHETEWYRPFVERHPSVVHAFGVDTRVMRPHSDVDRDIDWLMVGRPASYKRPDELLTLDGHRVLVGDLDGVPASTLDALTRGGVELIDFVPYQDLADLYARARAVLVPCTLHGGGERAVLEARACGADVRIAADNPKLEELASGRVFDHEYYARQLAVGLHRAQSHPLPRARKWASHQVRRAAESRARAVVGRAVRTVRGTTRRPGAD